MVLAVIGLDDVQSLPVIVLGFREVPPFELDGREIEVVFSDIRMAIAEELTVHFQAAAVQEIGFGVVAQVELAISQISQSAQEVGCDSPLRGLLAKSCFENRDGMNVFTARNHHASKCA